MSGDGNRTNPNEPNKGVTTRFPVQLELNGANYQVLRGFDSGGLDKLEFGFPGFIQLRTNIFELLPAEAITDNLLLKPSIWDGAVKYESRF